MTNWTGLCGFFHSGMSSGISPPCPSWLMSTVVSQQQCSGVCRGLEFRTLCDYRETLKSWNSQFPLMMHSWRNPTMWYPRMLCQRLFCFFLVMCSAIVDSYRKPPQIYHNKGCFRSGHSLIVYTCGYFVVYFVIRTLQSCISTSLHFHECGIFPQNTPN